MLEELAALPNIVYAHTHAPWDSPWSRQQYLMSALSQHTRVFYLDLAPFSPRFTKVLRPHAEVLHPNLIVVRNAHSLRRSRWRRLGKFVEKIVSDIDSRRLNAIFEKHGAQEFTFFMGIPDLNLLRSMTMQNLIYDCMDPAFSTEELTEYDALEFSVAQRAQIVLCSAQSLFERLEAYNERIYLVPNACSYEEYAPELNSDIALPRQLEGRSAPIIGFSGYIDGRVDIALLEAAARRLPQYTFVIAGGVRFDRAEQFEPVKLLPNVLFLDTIPVDENRAWVKTFDVCLIPFLPNRANDCLNTVKMWMYFAAGKPVVSTNLRESRLHRPYVDVTQNEDDFVAAIVNAVEKDTPEKIEARLDFARRNTWQQRAQAIVDALRKA